MHYVKISAEHYAIKLRRELALAEGCQRNWLAGASLTDSNGIAKSDVRIMSGRSGFVFPRIAKGVAKSPRDTTQYVKSGTDELAEHL